MSDIIIGVAGPARSGKNTTASYLQKYHAFHEDSFAAPIREACIRILGLSGLDELDKVKQSPHPLLGNKTPREFMQLMGTEFGRQMIYDDIWVQSCIERCSKYQRVVISDVRFDNEAEAIKQKGGFIILVDRPDVRIEQSAHASESGINFEYIDYQIVNDSTFGDLYTQIERNIRYIFNEVYKSDNQRKNYSR